MFTRVTGVKHPKGGFPEVLSGKYKTGELIVVGTILQLDANGELIVGVADPVDIVGVALQAAASGPGWDAGNSPTVVTGRVQEISYTVANESTVFVSRADNTGVLTDPLQTNIGEGYGLMNVAGEWRIDLTDTTAKRITVVDVELTAKLWYWKFTPAALLIP
jgi:hypothetical protein